MSQTRHDIHAPARLPRWESPAPHEVSYARARSEWDDRLGSARVQAASWRMFALAAISVAALAVVGLIYQSSKATVTPYIVEVGPGGAARLVGSPATVAWSPPVAAEREQIKRWLHALRSLPADEQVLTSRLTYARTHATAAANLLLDAWLERHDPVARFGTMRCVVHVRALTALASTPHGWRVEWREECVASGQTISNDHFSGVIHLALRAPRDEAELEVNPLGIWISFFSFDRHKDTP